MYQYIYIFIVNGVNGSEMSLKRNLYCCQNPNSKKNASYTQFQHQQHEQSFSHGWIKD